MQTKLALLDTLNWLWIVALLAAVYLFVAALFADGSRSSFRRAVSVGAVVKWLRSVSLNKIMTMSGRGAANLEEPREGKDIAGWNTEARNRHNEIVVAFFEHLKRYPENGEIRDVSELPYSKQEILDAYCLEVVRQKDPNACELMARILPGLAYYQEGVGLNPVRQIGMSVEEMEHFSRELAKAKSNQENAAIANTIAETISSSPEPDRYQECWSLVEQDLLKIESQIKAAKLLARTMPVEKKRSIFG